MYNTFFNWLFDGNIESVVPKEILAYNSPITHTYVISLFCRISPLNHFLDTVFNNIGLYSLSKEELFLYIKQCVSDFKVSNRFIQYVMFSKLPVLYEPLQTRLPFLQKDEVLRLCKIVDEKEDRKRIYMSLGLECPKVKKDTKRVKPKKGKKLSVKDYLNSTFIVERI